MILRGIRSSLNRFLSIMFIVALGAGFLSGLMATTPDMEDAADRYMDDTNWYDMDIKAPLGLTEDDAAAIADCAGVGETCAAYVRDAVLEAEDESSFTARVFGFLDETGRSELNRVELLEGELPSAPDECLIQAPSGYMVNLPSVGERLRLSDPDGAVFAYDEMRITGIVRGAMFISVEPEASAVGSGSVTLGVFVMSDFYRLESYTDVYVTVKGAAEPGTYSDEYAALIDETAEALRPAAESRAAKRLEQARSDAREALQSSEAALTTLRRVSEAKTALEADAQIRLAQSEKVYALIEGGGSKIVAHIKATNARLRESLNDPSRGEALPILADVQKGIEDAQALIDMPDESAEWQMRTREQNTGYAGYRDNSEKVAALCTVFPVFFFAVAMLVALTTMTRLVEENRTHIGTLKAIGFTDGQVLGEYLLYSLFASALGCALGFAIGFRVFPRVISGAYGMMYTLPEVRTPIIPRIALPVGLLTIGGTLAAAWLACVGVTRMKPAELMTPKAPRAGKRVWAERIPWLWKRLSFTWKLTVRNLFRYKKRLYMTVFGIMGCSALLVTGFGLRDSIHDIVNKQFGELYKYNLMAVVTDADAPESDAELRAMLNDKSITEDYLPFMSESGTVLFGGRAKPVSLGVPKDTERLGSFILLRERISGKPVELKDDAVLLTEKLCEELGIRAGDSVTLENIDGRRAQVAVSGIIENYISACAYLSPKLYARLFAEEPVFGELLIRLTPEGNTADTASRVLACGDVVYTFSTRSIEETFSDSVKSIDAIVVVLILSAGILSMVVLYNLINVNLCERRKELATIRVLGFRQGEVEHYVFREIYVLSALGTLLGLAAGIWLHGFVVRTVEINAVMFGRSIGAASFVYSAAISFAFTWLLCRLMRRSVNGVDMVESMKAND